MSDRGTAIQCFNARVPALTKGELTLEDFRKLVTEDISKALNMAVDECGYLFNKARRAAERSGKFNELDFGAAKRAQPVAKAEPAEAGGEKVAQGTVVREGAKSRKREDLESFTVVEIVEGCVGRTYSYGNQGVAQLQHGSRIKRHGGVWALIQGLGPNSGEEYRLRDGEKELACNRPV